MKGSLHSSLFLWLLGFIPNVLEAQTISTGTDRKAIIIGEQFQYRVEATFPGNRYMLHWFSLPDSFSHFEVIYRGKTDSSENNGMINYSQVIVLTSFDSGINVLPAFSINFYPLTHDSALTVQTDTIPILVTYSPLDSTKDFHDIKTIIDIKDEWPLWKWILLICLVLLAVSTIILIFYSRKKRLSDPFSSGLTPFDEAMQAMKTLKEKGLLEMNEIKQFHSRLIQIFRRYISRKTHTEVLNLTSSEILLLLQSNKIQKESLSKAANALRMSDAVKFAKYQPPFKESESGYQDVEQVIKQINELSSTSSTGDL